MATGQPIHGVIETAPPGMSLPPETGYTPIWERHRGLLYVPNSEVPGVNLSVGAFIKFYLKTETGSSGATINVAYDISNF